MKAAVGLALLVVATGCASAASPTPSASTTSATPSGPPVVHAGAPAGAPPERLVAATSVDRPTQPDLAAGFRAELVADPCTDRDLVTPPAADVALSVLDRSYALPASYAPTDLVPAAAAGLGGDSSTVAVREVVVEDLAALRAAWEAAGIEIIVESAYRSYASQAATFDLWASRLGLAAALLRSARPGHSEHQLGTAIDVVSPGWSGRVGDWAADSAEGAWMAENAWRFGFVMSYPSGSEGSTCFGYEPWHYRWIGREAAGAHRASGLPLREFLERYVRG